jgi:hypothetical protein
VSGQGVFQSQLILGVFQSQLILGVFQSQVDSAGSNKIKAKTGVSS